MSYERGMMALNLKMPDVIPHTEYLEHFQFVKHITGIDPTGVSDDISSEIWIKFYRLTDYDFLWISYDGPEWKGKTASMGHAVYLEDKSDFNPDIHCPFNTPEEVLNFDPVKEFGIPDIEKRAKLYQECYEKGQKENPDLVFPGGYYKTLFSACIHVFGWDMFLSSAPLDYEKFDRVLEGFFQISMANYKAWSKTDIKAFICHDDIVWTNGPVFRPDWYRKYIFPRYKKLWQPIKERGVKLLFCSDGNFDEFVDDIAEVGADGFIFEPLTNLERIVEKYGKSKVIIGNADVRILTFRKKEDIYNEVKRCIDLGKKCPGYFITVGNHIPYNVPLENLIYYFDLKKKLCKRREYDKY